MNKKQYQTAVTWQDSVFTHATAASCANHLEEEVAELKSDIENKSEEVVGEIADCFLLLFGVCNKLGLNYESIVRLIDAKLEVNRQRQWGKPNDKGYVKHV